MVARTPPAVRPLAALLFGSLPGAALAEAPTEEPASYVVRAVDDGLVRLDRTDALEASACDRVRCYTSDPSVAVGDVLAFPRVLAASDAASQRPSVGERPDGSVLMVFDCRCPEARKVVRVVVEDRDDVAREVRRRSRSGYMPERQQADGGAMFGGGLLLAAGGMVLLVGYRRELQSPDLGIEDTPKVAGLGVGGVACLGVGISLAVAGAVNVEVGKARAERYSLAPLVGPEGGGVLFAAEF